MRLAGSDFYARDTELGARAARAVVREAAAVAAGPLTVAGELEAGVAGARGGGGGGGVGGGGDGGG